MAREYGYLEDALEGVADLLPQEYSDAMIRRKENCPPGTKPKGKWCRLRFPDREFYIDIPKGESCPPGTKGASSGYCVGTYSEAPYEYACPPEQPPKSERRSSAQRSSDERRSQEMKGETPPIPRKKRDAGLRKAQKVREECYSETLDFQRCVRPDGTAYGTAGTCRKGVPSELELPQARVERKIAERIPQSTVLDGEFNDDGSLRISLKLKDGNTIIVGTGGSETYFLVNGKYDTGTVKDRKSQVRVALAVGSLFDIMVSELPQGTHLFATAYDDDGKGSSRAKGYRRLGFAEMDKYEFYGKVDKRAKHKVAPLSEEEVEEDYAEAPEQIEAVRIWLGILFGHG